MPADLDAFERARHTTNIWLASVADELDTDDRRYALRTLRAWLHTVRDRLPVDSAAKFAAQLPELLRGIYYDGWEPNRVPIKYSPEEYVTRFGLASRTPDSDVPEASAAVAAALARHLSGGQLAEVLAQMPRELRELVAGRRVGVGGAETRGRARGTPEFAGSGGSGEGGDGGGSARAGATVSVERLARLEAKVSALTDAVEVLARGMQQAPQAEPDPERASRSARLATEILMAGRS